MKSGLDFQFAVVSDLHIGLPLTIHDHPSRFHLVEWSIPALEQVLEHLNQVDLDFLLLPGDLTQHGEPDNHRWLAERLKTLSYPTYVIPGNHDIPVPKADQTSIAPEEFPQFYQAFGYGGSENLEYYCQSLLPGVALIGLNSNHFNDQGTQVGSLTAEQLQWLDITLGQLANTFVLVMVHHNILEHFPNQTEHPIGHRYMLSNADSLRAILRKHGVQFVFTGHLHVQDIMSQDGLVDITTGSLVSYPHPYRLVHIHPDPSGELVAEIQSFKVNSIALCEDVQGFSRQWMGDRSEGFMMKMLTQAPLNLSLETAQQLVPQFKYFWATIAQGDPKFEMDGLPEAVQDYLRTYEQHQTKHCDLNITDNNTIIPVRAPATVPV